MFLSIHNGRFFMKFEKNLFQMREKGREKGVFGFEKIFLEIWKRRAVYLTTGVKCVIINCT